ncbi:histidinol-phosphate transaminase [Ancylomarina sp. 16SWW S1-10-2]|uniref:pyridoxal phosphate-dependent aminotransferase n=1 Tax=Ancylomarina sp. 16SWW S1-10-2 TaxID=2499681 RepID=UPI0012AE4493|nr:aminotransferase class I/II-fold pyridoxal phosphate-dependent enzyme [Ancylomarina sp. 16SWW S1-10-2]MRT92734.1 aminotransferase class I/II-fold pyridoxal phosphate-dependent enzyme [Ancylomarina sp. 16SWW S1-10-2]
MLHGHGDDAYLYKHAIKANFSTNIWYGGKSENLNTFIKDNLDKIYAYPEAAAESLNDLIALDQNVSSDQVLTCNGATEAFYLIAQAYHSKTSIIITPTFAEYEDACMVNKHQLNFINWSNLQSTTLFAEGLVWLCNPNNPDGRVVEKTFLETLLKNNPKSTFVIDEAYIDFTDAISSAIDLIDKYPNLILVKSLTKNFSIPGLRLGYLISNKVMVQNIRFFKPPWTVNSIAIEVGKYILQRKQSFLPPVKQYKSDRKEFAEKLAQIPALKIWPSETSYFLIELEKSSASELKNYLISEFGLLIRDASNFRGLNEKFIRVATLTKEKNQLLIDALTQWSKLN